MIYLSIWLALGVVSLLYCLVTEGSYGELFTLEGLMVALVIVLLGPIGVIFLLSLHISMRNK